MKILSPRTRALVGILGLTAFAHCDIDATYTAVNGSLTGLYDASGTSINSMINVDSVDYNLKYSTSLSPTQYHHSTATGTYRTRVTFHFSTNGWQTYRTGSTIGAVGVKVMNYAGYNSSPLEQFLGDTGTGISSVQIKNNLAPPNPPYPASVAFADVMPKKILYSSLTVNSSDATGKTGYIEFDSAATTGRPEVWDAALSNPHGAPWTAQVWLFPQWGAAGFSPHQVLPNYPVEAP